MPFALSTLNKPEFIYNVNQKECRMLNRQPLMLTQQGVELIHHITAVPGENSLFTVEMAV